MCGQNRSRSLTAERIFAGSRLYDVRSRGVASNARIRLAEPDIAWADVIFVMEKEHKNRITGDFGAAAAGKEIVCLFIKDEFAPMEEALIAELRRKLAPHLELPGTGNAT